MTNSRMKDYLDLLVLLRADGLADASVVDAVVATFQRRGTPLPGELPPGLSDEFGADERASRLWRELVRRMQVDDVPQDFATVVAEVRDRIWPILVRARSCGSP